MTVCDSTCEVLAHPAGPRGLRIALISLHTSPLVKPGVGDAGGMNVYLKAAAAALARAGHRVDIYSRATSAADLAHPSQSIGGAVAHYLRAGPVAPVDKSELAPLAGEFAAALGRYPKPDVVHSHYWLSGLAGEAAAEAWGIPHVQSLHTVATIKNRALASGDAPEGSARLAGEQGLARRAARVVTVSAAERDAIVRDYGVPGERVAVISPGVDGSVFGPGPGPCPDDLPEALRRRAGYLMMIGRIQPLKGQDLAIRALAELPPGLRPALVVTGAPGPGHLEYAASLKSLVAALGLAGDVVFMGTQRPERLAELLRGARASLMPSHSETFGLVAIESAACGAPVIGSDTTGLRSSVIDSVTGLLVRSRRPEAWAGAIRRVLQDAELARKLSAGGVNLGRERTWDHVAAALAATYAAVAASAPR
ncbi:MAG: glycosyltransferase [Bifidobacteriaceae bacterium]|jgi:D-inositol-3-phosphate glycosyltransferase|nr:glycosyltransferase [Bifidobacteriaceae bacterium]